jgi:hypothetical protein
MVRPRKFSAIYIKVVLLLSLAAIVSILLTNGGLVPAIAHSSGKRVLDIRVPGHLPIEVKLKKEKEKAVEDATNDKWLRDFELEVTNTGDKPIFFLSLMLIADDVMGPNGFGMGWGLHYVRGELGDLETKASADDVPIKPGETYVFSLADRLQDWERFRERENKPDAAKLILKFQILAFGDGTGFWTNDGVPSPRPLEQKSGNGR